MRDEIGETVSAGHIKRIALLYTVLFVVGLAVGGVLWTTGSRGLALVVWLFGNGFTAFVGLLTVTWDAFEYVGERRSAAADRSEPDRELYPTLTLASDTRIAVKVFAVLFAVGLVAGLVFWTVLV